MNGPALIHPSLASAARWRWPVLAALLATIPAFYIELLDRLPHAWASAVYAGAALTLLLAQLRIARHNPHPRSYLRRQAVDGLLVAGLLTAALLPPSTASNAALTLRLLVAFLSLVRMVRIVRPWVTRGSLRHVLMLSLVVLGVCGIGFWLLEPRVQTIGDGLWLAFTTAATVGYGDLVPTTPASKIFAVFVVLLGYAALSLVTAAIAAVWVESAERQVERDILRELHAEVKTLRAELAELRHTIRH